ncbi:MAG: class I SAM-dependent methyltransferase [Pseudomonadota bacterium]
MTIEPSKYWQTALDGYDDQLKSIVAGYPQADILELGGGRRPSFAISDMPSNIATYTVNDVSADELALTAPEYEKACFDVGGDASNFEGRYDVVFSRFLAEHVRNGHQMHRNVHRVLKPGGVAFHLIPTLYASPFVINRLLPERLTHKMLTTLFPIRKTISPKFPAYYSVCRGNTPGMRKTFADMGYRQVEIREFYGHYYYDRLPVIRDIENALSSIAAKNDWSWYTSYAYITAYK